MGAPANAWQQMSGVAPSDSLFDWLHPYLRSALSPPGSMSTTTESTITSRYNTRPTTAEARLTPCPYSTQAIVRHIVAPIPTIRPSQFTSDHTCLAYDTHHLITYYRTTALIVYKALQPGDNVELFLDQRPARLQRPAATRPHPQAGWWVTDHRAGWLLSVKIVGIIRCNDPDWLYFSLASHDNRLDHLAVLIIPADLQSCGLPHPRAARTQGRRKAYDVSAPAPPRMLRLGQKKISDLMGPKEAPIDPIYWE
ncbi:hypothetical protein FPV67DRAFT_1456091 [Lyophyllum atratum]|nr:hypothetical protein FPV67DRAFT_1456091 [Lyophyllum atratum]